VVSLTVKATATMADEEAPPPRYTILALYKFVTPHWEENDLTDLRAELEGFLRPLQVVGNLLLATEGINGTVCYPRNSRSGGDASVIDDPVYTFFVQRLPGIRLRRSYDDRPAFHRLRLRRKQEIVTLGLEARGAADPCVRVGTYVPPGPAWHDLLRDPQTLVVDTRNAYEVALGTFRRAVSPGTDSFTEFPAWLEQQLGSGGAEDDAPSHDYQRLAFFCTGGIRCEKATSYCLQHPVVAQAKLPVFHLEGGILAYLDQIAPSESMFEGECFVFDQRTAVAHGLVPSREYSLCHACRHPLTQADRASADYCEGVACSYCLHAPDKQVRRERYEERQKQCLLSTHTPLAHIHDGKRQTVESLIS
jgi:UPF0176 protein